VLRDAVSVVADGLRLVGRHWPVLLTIFLLGASVRAGVLWGAVVVSAHHPTVAGLMLPFAPLGSLAALILMLRAVSPSLRHATFTPEPEQPGHPEPVRRVRRVRRTVDTQLSLLASTLVPFLAVYAAQGYLKEDAQKFVNEATYDAIFARALSSDSVRAPDRIAIAEGALMVAIVVVALGLRWMIDRFDLPQRHRGWAFVAAYVEVFWLFTLAKRFSGYQDQVRSWLDQRELVAWARLRWADVVDALGPVGHPVEAAVAWLGGILGDADTIVVVPIAWLTVGAVVYGRNLTAPAHVARPMPERWAGGLTRVRSGVQRVPSPVRRWGTDAVADLRGRFAGLGSGLRLLAVAGLVPMLLFCLVFFLARQAEYLGSELWRALLGPMDRDTGVAFAPHLLVVDRAVYTVLLVGLLAAAIDRIVRHRDEPDVVHPAVAEPATNP
jgi:hypothetical protein